MNEFLDRTTVPRSHLLDERTISVRGCRLVASVLHVAVVAPAGACAASVSLARPPPPPRPQLASVTACCPEAAAVAAHLQRRSPLQLGRLLLLLLPPSLTCWSLTRWSLTRWSLTRCIRPQPPRVRGALTHSLCSSACLLSPPLVCACHPQSTQTAPSPVLPCRRCRHPLHVLHTAVASIGVRAWHAAYPRDMNLVAAPGTHSARAAASLLASCAPRAPTSPRFLANDAMCTCCLGATPLTVVVAAKRFPSQQEKPEGGGVQRVISKSHSLRVKQNAPLCLWAGR